MSSLYNKTFQQFKEAQSRLIFLEKIEFSAREAEKRRLEIEEDYFRLNEINQRQNQEIANLMHQIRIGNTFQIEVRRLRSNETNLKKEIDKLKNNLKENGSIENKKTNENVFEVLKVHDDLNKANSEIETLKKENLILQLKNDQLENEKAIFYEGFNAANATLEKERLKVYLLFISCVFFFFFNKKQI